MGIINKTNKEINLNDVYFVKPFKCTDASIYYENNIPYIDWKGEAKLSDGSIFKMHIPKMGLDVEEIEHNTNTAYDLHHNIYTETLISKQIFVKNSIRPDEDIFFEITKCEMTKEQIEKELGYKIKIK